MLPPVAVMLAAGILLAGTSALADVPPENARPLSQIVQDLEARGDFAHVDEIEWDDDGYWEIEYVTRERAKVKLKIDPVTGQSRD